MNNYSFALDSPCVLIHSAHYSKNWNKSDQNEYNAKYYQEHKEKWGVKGGYSESDKEVKYTGQIGDYGTDDLDKLLEEHGELGEDNWLGEGGDVSLTTTKDGTQVLLNGDSIVASGKDLDGIDTKTISKYLTDIYAQAGDHAADKGIKTGTKEHAAFWREFDAKVNEQLKGLIAKQKQMQHDDLSNMPIMNDYLAHHGILGMKHGVKNGPPYPLGSGAHSSSETRAAKSAGISVGSSSGKGSIENVKSGKKLGFFEKQRAKKQAKADEEEKKRKAEEAATKRRRSATLKRLRSEGNGFDGDDDPEYLDDLYEKYKKKDFDDNISKMRSSMKNNGYSDDEIEARVKKVAGEGYKPVAQNTERTAEQYEREQEKASAIARGDAKTLYTKYASEMSTEEINRVNDRISKMNALKQNVPKEPTTLDKVEAAVNTLDRVNKMAGKLIGVYNTAASINNTLRPDSKWVRVDGGGNKKDPVKDAVTKTLSNAVNEAAKQQDKDKKK